MFDVAPAVRALDAFGAKAYLSRRPFVRDDRVGLLGMSHGAWAALIAAFHQGAPIEWIHVGGMVLLLTGIVFMSW